MTHVEQEFISGFQYAEIFGEPFGGEQDRFEIVTPDKVHVTEWTNGGPSLWSFTKEKEDDKPWISEWVSYDPETTAEIEGAKYAVVEDTRRGNTMVIMRWSDERETRIKTRRNVMFL